MLTGDGHAGRVYDVTSGESLTQAEQVRIIGDVIGRPLRFEEVDVEPVKQMLGQFMDPPFVDALFGLLAETVGKPAPTTPVVERLTGHPPRTFAQWAADHAAEFTGA